MAFAPAGRLVLGLVLLAATPTAFTVLVEQEKASVSSAQTRSDCRYISGVDYHTSSADGFVVKGPNTQQQCCVACITYVPTKAGRLCRASIWVPSAEECVIKLDASQPVPTTKPVLACVVPGTPMPPTPPPTPALEQTYLLLDRRNVVSTSPGVELKPVGATALVDSIKKANGAVLAKIHGLKNAQHLNGLTGTVIKNFKNGRKGVCLANGEEKSEDPPHPPTS